MSVTNDMLNELRRLRIEAAEHYADAAEYLNRATNGTGTKRATDMGGTRCPLTDYADQHAKAYAQYRESASQANAIWARVQPFLCNYDLDTQSVIELFYNQGEYMLDVAKAVKRSMVSCERMQARVHLTLKMEERNAD